MWKPKSKEFEELARTISHEYMAPPEGNGLSVPEIARIYKLSFASVHRYLQFTNTPIRPRKRGKNGRFIFSR